MGRHLLPTVMNHPIQPTRLRSITLIFLLPAASVVASAQGFADSVKRGSTHSVPVPSATASVRYGSIRIDGHIDEDAWSKATPVTDFLQTDPSEGKPATQRTEVRFLYDENGLYVAARMFDTQAPAGIVTRLVRRDASMRG